jgi:His-Xaa-Ser system protein HxsD
VSGSSENTRSEVDSEFSATVYLDPRIYTREAILRASYWFTDVAHIHAPESPNNRLAIHISLKQPKPTLGNPDPPTIKEVVSAFCNSIIDFELRRQVEDETASVRQLILAKAFSESGVLEDEPPGAIADPVETRTPSSLIQIMSSSKK